jgi:hypothetical protein
MWITSGSAPHTSHGADTVRVRRQLRGLGRSLTATLGFFFIDPPAIRARSVHRGAQSPP